MGTINYLDWTLQDAGKKYDLLTKYGLPIIAMEPTRGGRLCNLGEKAAPLKLAQPNFTQAAWAFKYLQSLENMAIVLSGMSNMEQLNENLELFAQDDKLTDQDIKTLDEVVKTIAQLAPCTACKYCVDTCPKALDCHFTTRWAMRWPGRCAPRLKPLTKTSCRPTALPAANATRCVRKISTFHRP